MNMKIKNTAFWGKNLKIAENPEYPGGSDFC